jgi:signal transduction histidine kinase
MGRYVNELLLVASANRPDFLTPAPVDVGELSEGLLARVSALGDRDWALVRAPKPGEVFIEADADRLTQAVVNLANNAVQHTADGSRIELAVDAGPRNVRFSVRDHGPGVAPEVREHLFTRFSRAAGSRAMRPEGTGLGLAIVAAVAAAHGGSVALEDPPGGGARFIVEIPCQRGPQDTDHEERP